MDWDGVGTFAMFIATGGIGVSLIAFRAYKAQLAAKIEMARLGRTERADEETLDHIRELEEQVRQLGARVDFTERLLEKGSEAEVGEP